MAHRTNSAETLSAFRNFDSAPDSAHVKLPVVAALFACSAATVYRRIKAGTLPAPRKFSERNSAWNVGEVRRALATTVSA